MTRHTDKRDGMAELIMQKLEVTLPDLRSASRNDNRIELVMTDNSRFTVVVSIKREEGSRYASV